MVSQLFAATYYVSPTGTASNSGTLESAPTTLSEGCNKIVAGDVLILLNGTYNVVREQYVYQKGSATGNWITIKAKNKGGAVIVGTSTYYADAYAVFYLYGCKRVIVDGIVTKHNSGSQDQVPGIRVSNASDYVTIRNCTSYDNGAAGITSEGSDHIIFEDNVVYGNCKRNAINTSGLSMYRQKDLSGPANEYWGCIMRRNICFNNQCDLPYSYNGESFPSPTDGNGIIIDYFDYSDASNTAYSKKVLLENNLCYNNGGKGIQIYKSSKVLARNNTIYHNNRILKIYVTSATNSFTAELGLFEPQGIGGQYNDGIYNKLVVADNTFTKNYAMAIENDMSKVYSNYLVGQGVKVTNYQPNAAQFATGNTIVAITNQTAPKFVSPGTTSSANFKLQSTSPCINKYTQAYGPTEDLIKVARPQGSGTDLGCYEYKSTTAREETSEANSEEYQFTIYPNPTTDLLKVSILDLNERNMEVELLDMTGRAVINKSYEIVENQQFVEINVGNLQTGIYFLKATQGAKLSILKMIKQ